MNFPHYTKVFFLVWSMMYSVLVVSRIASIQELLSLLFHYLIDVGSIKALFKGKSPINEE
jgi:hypothetical protein